MRGMARVDSPRAKEILYSQLTGGAISPAKAISLAVSEEHATIAELPLLQFLRTFHGLGPARAHRILDEVMGDGDPRRMMVGELTVDQWRKIIGVHYSQVPDAHV